MMCSAYGEIGNFPSISTSKKCARTGRYDSHNVTLADALVAACSRVNNLKLWTMNKKHYPMLEEDEFTSSTIGVGVT